MRTRCAAGAWRRWEVSVVCNPPRCAMCFVRYIWSIIVQHHMHTQRHTPRQLSECAYVMRVLVSLCKTGNPTQFAQSHTYECVYACVTNWDWLGDSLRARSHTQIYMLIWIYMCVCARVHASVHMHIVSRSTWIIYACAAVKGNVPAKAGWSWDKWTGTILAIELYH